MKSLDRKSIELGPEWDNELREILKQTLKEVGAVFSNHSWGVVGSQEIETLDVTIGDQKLHVEAETYMGLSLSGPPEFVDAIAKQIMEKYRKPPV